MHVHRLRIELCSAIESFIGREICAIIPSQIYDSRDEKSANKKSLPFQQNISKGQILARSRMLIYCRLPDGLHDSKMQKEIFH